MNSKLLVYINDIPVYVVPGTTVIQACDQIGVNIPRFCYHDLLEIAGNCRICLVEVEKSPKPQASCGLPVVDQIRIYTDTPLVKKARESVLEFLLLNHPLDCPICDQGGQCDLQNQALTYGNTRSRFYFKKRGVNDKGLGPIVKTAITRCIHCTRCVRFACDIGGVEDLGTTLRGTFTEIGTYVKKTLNSEVSGNIIDLCPVGALTSKVHAFKARPWEVKTTQSIDHSDSLGSNIIIESIHSYPLRMVPRPNKRINLEWLSDKGRFIYEGYCTLRLAYPFFSIHNKLYKFTSKRIVKDCLNATFFNYRNPQIGEKFSIFIKIIVGKRVDLETYIKIIILSKTIQIDIESETPCNIFPSLPAYFQSGISLEDIQSVDSCLLLGVNPRIEATIANLRLRNRFKTGLFNVINIGNSVDLTYPTYHIGLHILTVYHLLRGSFSHSLGHTKKPLFIYGDTLSQRIDSYSSLLLTYTYQRVKQIKNWLGVIRFPQGSNSIGKSFFGIAKPILNNYKEIKNISYYLVGPETNKSLKTNPVVVETTHVNDNLLHSQIVLPLQSVLEKNGSFINYTGSIQKNIRTFRIGIPPLKYLAEFYTDLQNQQVGKNSSIEITNSFASTNLQYITQDFIQLLLYTSPYKSLLSNIYSTDPFSNASLTCGKLGGNLRKTHWVFLKD